MKAIHPTSSSTVYATTQRTFGEVLNINNKTDDPSPLLLSGEGTESTTECSSGGDASTSPSDSGSTFAQLRSRLNELSQKNDKQQTIAHGDELVVERRPKVRPSMESAPGPTPLPPHAAHALVKRIPVAAAATAAVVPSSSAVAAGKRSGTVHFDKASTVVPASSSKSSTAAFRARSTPVRIKVPVLTTTSTSNVQATNEGYASVAELSRWLADDPTSTKKKMRHLRRGANIIAKSRKFDKVLANIVIVEESIPRDCVSKRKEKLLELTRSRLSQSTTNTESRDDSYYTDTRSLAHDEANNGEDDDDGNISVHSMMQLPSTKKDWMMLGTTSSASVADKKKWLSNAFPTTKAAALPSSRSENSSSSTSSGTQKQELHSRQANDKPVSFSSAQSEVILTTSHNLDTELGNRAKERWRRNRTPTKEIQPSKISAPVIHPPRSIQSQGSHDTNDSLSSATISFDMAPLVDAVNAVGDNCTGRVSVESEPDGQSASVGAKEDQTKDADDDISLSTADNAKKEPTPVGFHMARQLLVKRSKANGNDVSACGPVQKRTTTATVVVARRAFHRRSTIQSEGSHDASDSLRRTATVSFDVDTPVDLDNTDAIVDSRSTSASGADKTDIKDTPSLPNSSSSSGNLEPEDAEVAPTAVGFHQARQLLVQRSKANGNDVEVVSAVKRRAQRFETLDKEIRRKSSAEKGLLKSAWEETEKGYVKKYREDVAPKKGLHELP